MRKNKKVVKVLSKKTARRWLKRNQHQIASLKSGVFDADQKTFLKQYLKCQKAAK